ncbi:reverse transcriptase domain-containing protein [Tanacetum coccineum]
MGFMPNTRPDAKTPKDTLNIHHVSMTVLTMGHRHLRTHSGGPCSAPTSQWIGEESQQVPHAWSQSKIRKKIVRWVDKLPNILWAHRTMLKTSNGETPFSLMYESEAVISAEIGMPTYWTIQFNEAQSEEEIRLNLDLIQEIKEKAAIREAKYKKRWSNTKTRG